MLELLFAALLGFLGAKAAGDSNMNAAEIRSDYGSMVYMTKTTIKYAGKPNETHGTGFAVYAPSGKKFIMTNRHVCAGTVDGIVKVRLKDKWYKKKVIKISKVADLCLLEGFKNLPAFEVADELYMDEEVASIGHPGATTLTVMTGHFMSYMNATFGYATYEILTSNFVAIPGSSGSPVINGDGEVVAVVMGLITDAAFAASVPLKYVKAFIANE